MDHGLEWAESGPDESLKGGWGGWSPGGQKKNSGVAEGVGEGGGPDPPRAYRKGDRMPPWSQQCLLFLPSVSSLDQQLQLLLFHETLGNLAFLF